MPAGLNYGDIPALVCLAVYLGGLALAALWDLARFIIPNRLVGAIAVAGLAALALEAPGWPPVLYHIGVAAGVLLGGSLLFFIDVWGAGDAKLLAAVALWTGSRGLAEMLLGTALAGGGLALLILLLRHLPFLNRLSLKSSHPALLSSQQGIPYGVAIAAGGILAFCSGNTALSETVIQRCAGAGWGG